MRQRVTITLELQTMEVREENARAENTWRVEQQVLRIANGLSVPLPSFSYIFHTRNSQRDVRILPMMPVVFGDSSERLSRYTPRKCWPWELRERVTIRLRSTSPSRKASLRWFLRDTMTWPYLQKEDGFVGVWLVGVVGY